jgi:membrane dipeptidase
MLQKRTILFLIALGVLLGACKPTNQLSGDEIIAKARGIHKNVITIDTHVDIPFNFATEEVDPGVRGDSLVDLPKMREGGLDAAFFVVFVAQTERTPENIEKAKADAMMKFDAIHRMAEKMYPDQIEIAYTADDVERIHKNGKLVAAICIENGYAIGRDLSLIEKYQKLGARYITLAHGGHNDISDSAMPRDYLGDGETEHNGISAFGEKVIAEMNRVGMMVDVSHISKKACLDAMKLSKAPVIASHSSTHAIRKVPRNMDDEQLMALKENGGVIQIVAVDEFVKQNSPEKSAAMEMALAEFGIKHRREFRTLDEASLAKAKEARKTVDEKYPDPNVQDFVDHIDHAVKLIGIDHVGIASDFDGGGGIAGWRDASETLNVTTELVRRGYSEEDIRKLWGANALRVWRDVERVSAEMNK